MIEKSLDKRFTEMHEALGKIMELLTKHEEHITRQTILPTTSPHVFTATPTQAAFSSGLRLPQSEPINQNRDTDGKEINNQTAPAQLYRSPVLHSSWNTSTQNSAQNAPNTSNYGSYRDPMSSIHPINQQLSRQLPQTFPEYARMKAESRDKRMEYRKNVELNLPLLDCKQGDIKSFLEWDTKLSEGLDLWGMGYIKVGPYLMSETNIQNTTGFRYDVNLDDVVYQITPTGVDQAYEMIIDNFKRGNNQTYEMVMEAQGSEIKKQEVYVAAHLVHTIHHRSLQINLFAEISKSLNNFNASSETNGDIRKLYFLVHRMFISLSQGMLYGLEKLFTNINSHDYRDGNIRQLISDINNTAERANRLSKVTNSIPIINDTRKGITLRNIAMGLRKEYAEMLRHRNNVASLISSALPASNHQVNLRGQLFSFDHIASELIRVYDEMGDTDFANTTSEGGLRSRRKNREHANVANYSDSEDEFVLVSTNYLKGKGVCYGMVNTGRCKRPNCNYDHSPSAVEKGQAKRAQWLANKNSQRSSTKKVGMVTKIPDKQLNPTAGESTAFLTEKQLENNYSDNNESQPNQE